MKDHELRLAVIVGHSFKDGGAQACSPLSLSEYLYNKQVAEWVYLHAKKLGLDCRVFLRDGKTRQRVAEEVNAFCYQSNCCAVELHFDSFTNKDVRGTSTLYDMLPPESLELARLMQSAVSKLFKRDEKTNRGTKWLKSKDRGFYNLYALNMPACLIEPAFGSNTEDAKLLLELQKDYALVIATVANEFLKRE